MNVAKVDKWSLSSVSFKSKEKDWKEGASETTYGMENIIWKEELSVRGN